MTNKILIFMMIVFVGCGKEKPTEPTMDELIIGKWRITESIITDDSYSRTCEYKESGIAECSNRFLGFYYLEWRIEDNLLYENELGYEPLPPFIINFPDEETMILTDPDDSTDVMVGKRIE